WIEYHHHTHAFRFINRHYVIVEYIDQTLVGYSNVAQCIYILLERFQFNDSFLWVEGQEYIGKIRLLLYTQKGEFRNFYFYLIGLSRWVGKRFEHIGINVFVSKDLIFHLL